MLTGEAPAEMQKLLAATKRVRAILAAMTAEAWTSFVSGFAFGLRA